MYRILNGKFSNIFEHVRVPKMINTESSHCGPWQQPVQQEKYTLAEIDLFCGSFKFSCHISVWMHMINVKLPDILDSFSFCLELVSLLITAMLCIQVLCCGKRSARLSGACLA